MALIHRYTYTLGHRKSPGFHYEICPRIIGTLEKAVGKKLEVNPSSQDRREGR
jgi:hypothetical protein